MVVADSQVPGGERTKLLDFGIAKLTEEAGPVQAKTRTNSMMGTVYYMSPEQCKGAGKVDDRADVYSFGVMLYEMLSGERPFTGEGHGEIVVKQVMEEPPALRGKAPSVPEPLAALVHRMLHKDRAARPSMSEVLGALEDMRSLAPLPNVRVSAALPIATKSMLAQAAASQVGSKVSATGSVGHTATAAGQSQSVPVRNKGVAIWIGLGGLAVVALGIGLRSRFQSPPQVPAIQQPVVPKADPVPTVTAPANPAVTPTKGPEAAATVSSAGSEASVDATPPSRDKKGKPGKKGKKPSDGTAKTPSKPSPAPTVKPTLPKKRVIEE